MLKKVALGLVAVLVVLVVVISLRPDTFSVQRSATIAAPADKVYPHIANFHAWEAWSPWAKKDPAMKTTYTGPDSGVGARYAWSGNKDVGSGSMAITEATAPAKVVIDLHFLEPFEGKNLTTFTLQPDGAGTKVTWQMAGPMNFGSKAAGLFMDMDKMIGDDFDKGLATLKGVVEKGG